MNFQNEKRIRVAGICLDNSISAKNKKIGKVVFYPLDEFKSTQRNYNLIKTLGV